MATYEATYRFEVETDDEARVLSSQAADTHVTAGGFTLVKLAREETYMREIPAKD